MSDNIENNTALKAYNDIYLNKQDTIFKNLSYPIRTTKAQRNILNQMFHIIKDIYNMTLEEKINQYKFFQKLESKQPSGKSSEDYNEKCKPNHKKTYKWNNQDIYFKPKSDFENITEITPILQEIKNNHIQIIKQKIANGEDVFDYLKQVDYCTLPRTMVNEIIFRCHENFNSFLKGKKGFPKFKSFNKLNSIQIPNMNGCEIIKENNQYFLLMKMPTLEKFNYTLFRKASPEFKLKIFISKKRLQHFEELYQKSTLTGIKIIKDDKKFFISISMKHKNENIDISNNLSHEYLQENSSKTVGVDLGVSYLYVDSNGKAFKNLKETKILEKEIKYLNRKYKKIARGTKQGNRNKKLIRSKYKHMSNKRDYNAHVISKILANHDFVIFEDLNIKNMTSSASGTINNPGKKVKQKSGLNKAILDCAWGKLKEFTKYKSEFNGNKFIEVNPRNTSQICSCCGTYVKKKLSERIHKCTNVNCKYYDNPIDRDLNASLNIKHKGIEFIKQAIDYHELLMKGDKKALSDVQEILDKLEKKSSRKKSRKNNKAEEKLEMKDCADISDGVVTTCGNGIRDNISKASVRISDSISTECMLN